MKKPGLHQFIAEELDDLAPALAWSRLSNYWAHRVINEAANFMEYQESPEAEVDLMFLRDNADINGVFGFELEETKGQRFNRFAEYFEYCYAHAHRTSVNPPYDLPQRFEDIVAYRRLAVRSPKRTASELDGLMDDATLADMIADVSYQSVIKRQQRQEDRTLAALDFALSEMTGRTSIVTAQATDAGNINRDAPVIALTVEARDLDETMGLDKQYEILGDVDRNLLATDNQPQFYGSGIRWAYCQSLGTMRSIVAFQPEVRAAFFLMFNTFKKLMAVELQPVVVSDGWSDP